MNDVDFCIVGLGPAGLGAALKIAKSASRRTTLCLEGGVEASLRSCAILQNQNCRWSMPCQIVAGVGGAALMSSGKVSNYPAGRAIEELMPATTSTEIRLQEALREFRQYVPVQVHQQTATETEQAELYYAAKGFRFRYYSAHRFTHAHIVAGVTKMIADVSAAGVLVRTRATVRDIRTAKMGYELTVQTPDGQEVVRAKQVLLATGRSGGDLVSRLLNSQMVAQESGPIDIGVRLEFPVHFLPNIDAHHNDLKLHFKDARTFCVCKGGSLAPYRMGKIFLMEGYSDPAVPTAFTNLAITVRLNRSGFSQTIFDDVERRLLSVSGGWPVAQDLPSYIENHVALAPPACSIKQWRVGQISRCFDDDTSDRLHQAVNAFASAFIDSSRWKEVSVFAPEVDYYWPRLRLLPGFVTDSAGLYAAGDASGHFRGILQAFSAGTAVAVQMVEAVHD